MKFVNAKYRIMALSASILLTLSDCLPVKADELPENAAAIQEASIPEKESSLPDLNADAVNMPSLSETDTDAEAEEISSLTDSGMDTDTEEENAPSLTEAGTDADTEEENIPSLTEAGTDAEEKNMPSMTDSGTDANTDAEDISALSETASKENAFPPEAAAMSAEESFILTPDEAPAFEAAVEYYSHGYYVVMGTFTEFLPDTALVRPLYSPDGENWQPCGSAWDLKDLGTEEESALFHLQNQICLRSNDEPLKSYLAGELDSFYLKLQITRENGETYETQAALIERGGPQTAPEGISFIAGFIPSMKVRTMNPFSIYGRYQITVSENAAPEDISALLPNTIPVEIGLYQGIDFFSDGIVNCPITWKPISLSQLTAGESITIPDAAEEIVVPGGTLLNTPVGVFELTKPIALTDEIRLVLNVVSENENPTGVLTAENTGMEIAFHLKPTGAVSIRAYVLSTGDTEWKELPALSLPDAVDSQPSTANSGYALVMKNDWEPYRSYQAAKAAGEEPSPFLIGLKIEGGVYDGRQLILPWPGSYDPPLNLPVLGGSGGNEGNAGADNKNDSTEEGQRPGLPQQQENKAVTEAEENTDTKKETEGLETAPAQASDDNTEEPPAAQMQTAENNTEKQQTGRTQGDNSEKQQTAPSQTQEKKQPTQAQSSPPANSESTIGTSARADTAGQDNTKSEPYPNWTGEQTQDKPVEPPAAASVVTASQKTSGFSGKKGYPAALPVAAASAAGISIAIAISFHKAAAFRKILNTLRRLQRTK